MNLGKIVGDTRDPFLVKQLEDEKALRVKVAKERDKYSKELNEIARELGCYASSQDIIPLIKEHQESHRVINERFSLIFLIRRIYRFFILRVLKV